MGVKSTVCVSRCFDSWKEILDCLQTEEHNSITFLRERLYYIPLLFISRVKSRNIGKI